MEIPKDYQKELNLKQLFEDEIGSPLIFLIGALRSGNDILKKNAIQSMKESITVFKNNEKYLGMDFFAQWISQIELALADHQDDNDLIDKLQNIWNDFRKKAKNAGVV